MSLNAQYVLGAIAFLLVGGGIAWWTIRTRTGMSRRKAALEGLARQHGMEYRQYAGSLGDFRFPMLHSGDMRMFMNVVSGPWQGIPVVAADYWFGSGPANPYSTRRRRRTGNSRHYSLVVLGVGARCPRVSIERQGLPATLVEHLGLEDIQFESEEFNRRFRVRSEDARFATELLDPRMMAWLLSTRGEYGFEVVGHSALVYCQFGDADGIPGLLDTAVAFVRRVPGVVTHVAAATGPADPADAPSPVAALADADAEALRQAEADGEA
jgi:hypothetical protein